MQVLTLLFVASEEFFRTVAWKKRRMFKNNALHEKLQKIIA
jgi:predicted metal-dependent hydrolase